MLNVLACSTVIKALCDREQLAAIVCENEKGPEKKGKGFKRAFHIRMKGGAFSGQMSSEKIIFYSFQKEPESPEAIPIVPQQDGREILIMEPPPKPFQSLSQQPQ